MKWVNKKVPQIVIFSCYLNWRTFSRRYITFVTRTGKKSRLDESEHGNPAAQTAALTVCQQGLGFQILHDNKDALFRFVRDHYYFCYASPRRDPFNHAKCFHCVILSSNKCLLKLNT